MGGQAHQIPKYVYATNEEVSFDHVSPLGQNMKKTEKINAMFQRKFQHSTTCSQI